MNGDAAVIHETSINGPKLLQYAEILQAGFLDNFSLCCLP